MTTVLGLHSYGKYSNIVLCKHLYYLHTIYLSDVKNGFFSILLFQLTAYIRSMFAKLHSFLGLLTAKCPLVYSLKAILIIASMRSSCCFRPSFLLVVYWSTLLASCQQESLDNVWDEGGGEFFGQHLLPSFWPHCVSVCWGQCVWLH